MTHELTITVDDAVYQLLKPMVEQQTIDIFLRDFLRTRIKNGKEPSITALWGTLHQVDTSGLREETDRTI